MMNGLRRVPDWLIEVWRWHMNGRFAADFETTTDVSDCRVWAWAAADIDDPSRVRYGTDIKSFMRWLENIKDSLVLFHNLKFDSEFIYNYILDDGWCWVEDIRDSGPKTFTTLISDTGNHYCAKLRFSRHHVVELRDSLKVIPLPVSKIPAAFGFQAEDQKGEIDYRAHRPLGYRPTDAEWEYIREDVVIVAKAMKIMYDNGMRKMTAGSNALDAYKKSIGGARRFRKVFPVPLNDEEIRLSYKGGFTAVSSRFVGRDIGKFVSFDVNSLYPSRMRYELLPYGEPKRFTGGYAPDKMYPLWVMAVTIDATVKPDHIPCIQVKESAYADKFSPTEYIEDTKGPITRYVTNVDLDLIFEQYDVHMIEYHDGWKYKGSRGLFEDFIDDAMAEKVRASEEGNEGMRYISKLKMNSSYGKFGTNPVVQSCKPVKRDGRIWYERLEPEEREPVYIAAASFITAYARAYTIRAAQANYDRWVYADTDSIYLTGWEEPEGIEVHDTKLGAWKMEHRGEHFKALRPKTYVFVEDGKLTVHCAGLPARCHDWQPRDEQEAAEVPEGVHTEVTFDNFEIGARYWGKLYNVHADGGIVLEDRAFTIK